MEREYRGKLIKIFINENETYKLIAIRERIVEALLKTDVSGISVIKGFEGYGHKHHIHKEAYEFITHKMPLVLEILIKDEQLEEVLAIAKPLIKSGKILIADNIRVLSLKE